VRVVASLILILALGACTTSANNDDLEQARQRLKPTATNAEIADLIETCLHGQAVTAFTRTPDGGWDGSNVSELEIQVLQDCMAAAEKRYPTPPAPKSRAEFEVYYQLLVRESECLEQEGYSAEVPSLDTFVDSNGNWTPYDDVPLTREWSDLNQACPQDPWSYDDQAATND
jgi:hypothetical protein